MARIDIHRPSVVQPEDYEFVAFNYLKIDDLGSAMFLQAERARLRAHMARTGGKWSGHQHGGNCDICGSVNAIYTAAFFHKPSGKYVKTGLDCAEKLECAGVEAFRQNVSNALEANAGKRKAKAVLEKAGLGKAWEVYAANAAASRDEEVALDMVARLVKWGDISDKALNYLGVLVDRIKRAPEIAAARAAEAEAAKPVPVVEGRISVRGKVLTLRAPREFECGSLKMLLKHADGWKLWGTVPASVRSEIARGDEIEFVARIKVSDRDPKFGFISRPSKAKLIKALAA